LVKRELSYSQTNPVNEEDAPRIIPKISEARNINSTGQFAFYFLVYEARRRANGKVLGKKHMSPTSVELENSVIHNFEFN